MLGHHWLNRSTMYCWAKGLELLNQVKKSTHIMKAIVKRN